VVPPLREAIDACCATVGRDPSALGRSLCAGVVLGNRTIHGEEPLSGTPEDLAESFRAFAREGIDHLQVWVNPMTSEGIDAIAEVLAILDRG
jgi:alkanesulfonate monooxygenase SsuD/methylene tetrahydromethanopterin reductase-like flavin-dependent oxidoreductase (luciferase family)